MVSWLSHCLQCQRFVWVMALVGIPAVSLPVQMLATRPGKKQRRWAKSLVTCSSLGDWKALLASGWPSLSWGNHLANQLRDGRSVIQINIFVKEKKSLKPKCKLYDIFICFYLLYMHVSNVTGKFYPVRLSGSLVISCESVLLFFLERISNFWWRLQNGCFRKTDAQKTKTSLRTF